MNSKKAELLDKCKQLGVKPEELDAKVMQLEIDILEGLDEIEKILPSDGETNKADMPF